MSNKSKHDPLQQDMGDLESAVKRLMKYYDDTTIHGLVNCVMRGWIQGGRFTREYRELAAQAERNRAEGEAAEARVAALRASIGETTSPSGGIQSV